MPTTPTPAAPRRRKPTIDGLQHNFCEQPAELLNRGLRTGDPTADAAVAELRSHGSAARRALTTGLESGLATLHDPPPAIAELLRESEGIAAGADPELLERGDTASLGVEPFWSRMAFALGSLVHTYSAPAIARVLAGTGKLTSTDTAARRLAETGLWRNNAILPGGLLRGAPGYTATVQVRLLHARVRARALEGGWDTEEWGVPINQVDTARTWLDFTIVPFRALQRLGIDIPAEEERDLYRYWHTIAALLGLSPEFYRDITDHTTASELLELVDATNTPPDTHARTLVEALLGALIHSPLGGAMSMPEPETRRLLVGLTRVMQGDEMADGLGLERVDIAPFLPLLAMGNTGVRRWQRATPESWEQAMAESVEHRRAEFAQLPDTEYRAHAHTTQPRE